jgi:hypothetical protein
VGRPGCGRISGADPLRIGTEGLARHRHPVAAATG